MPIKIPSSYPLEVYSTELSIAQLSHPVALPPSSEGVLFNLTICTDEISVVAPTQWLNSISNYVLQQSDEWRAIKISQQLDFSMVGVIALISEQLSRKDISIFVLSTYKTDYILIRSHTVSTAIDTLKLSGHNIKLI